MKGSTLILVLIISAYSLTSQNPVAMIVCGLINGTLIYQAYKRNKLTQAEIRANHQKIFNSYK